MKRQEDKPTTAAGASPDLKQRCLQAHGYVTSPDGARFYYDSTYCLIGRRDLDGIHHPCHRWPLEISAEYVIGSDRRSAWYCQHRLTAHQKRRKAWGVPWAGRLLGPLMGRAVA